MSDQSFEAPAATTEQAPRDLHVAAAPRDLASYPERLFAHDMAAIYRISLKRFYALDAEGHFDFAIIKPRIGRKSWSRERVRQSFDGELRGLSVARRKA